MKNSTPNQKIFRFLFAILLFSATVSLYSQEAGSCAEKLKTAQSLFSKGQVEQIPSLLKDCLKSGFKTEEELTAYKLLIQTYLLNDKLEQADSTMYEFLKKNPEYVLSPTDHSSFVYLFNNFKVKPVLQLSIHAGVNVPFLTFVNTFLPEGEDAKSSFNSGIGNLFISVEPRFKIANKTEIGFEAGFSMRKFINNIDDNMNHALINYTESQQRIEVPVFVMHDFKSFGNGKFTIYGRAGIGAAYTLGVTATATYTPTDQNNRNSRTGETLNRKDSRIKVDCFGQIGAGLKYKIPRGFLFGELRSDIGILDQNVIKGLGGSAVPVLTNFYVWHDPSFRLNAAGINFGYTYIFYKPIKRKE